MASMPSMLRSLGALAVLSLVACGGAPPPSARRENRPRHDDRVARVTASLVPAVLVAGAPPPRATLEARMARFHVPGVSIAVADGGAIAWARGFGVTHAGSSDPVTPRTLFPAASISKPVTATAALRLVERGALALDAGVNTYLRTWRVPANEHTSRAPVTLRHLLSHTAGTNVHMMPCFHEGEPLPTLAQELDGLPPANIAPVRVETVPGTEWRYSGGGMLIAQMALTDVTGQPFHELLRQVVLDPLGMTESTFEQPVPQELRGRLAAEHDTRGALVPDWLGVCPEMAASGLTSTPADLVRWAIAIGDAYAGHSEAFLSRATATDMLTARLGPTGLGPFVEGEGAGFRFSHEGGDGGFHAEVVYFPATRQGAAVMVNGEAGVPLIREILLAVAAEHGWPDYAPRVVEVLPMSAEEAERLVGAYAAPYEGALVEARVLPRGDRLLVEIPILGVSSEIVLTSPTTLVMLEAGADVERVLDAEGRVTALRIGSLELPRIAR